MITNSQWVCNLDKCRHPQINSFRGKMKLITSLVIIFQLESSGMRDDKEKNVMDSWPQNPNELSDIVNKCAGSLLPWNLKAKFVPSRKYYCYKQIRHQGCTLKLQHRIWFLGANEIKPLGEAMTWKQQTDNSTELLEIKLSAGNDCVPINVLRNCRENDGFLSDLP